MRPGDAGDLVVHRAGGDGDSGGRWQQIIDLAQKALIGSRIMRAACILAMPFVNLALQRITLFKQRLVAGRQIAHQRAKAGPKRLARNACARQRLAFNEGVQVGINLEAFDVYASHDLSP